MIGTKVGKTLGPALYESSGNGALYAAISASLSCLRLPCIIGKNYFGKDKK